MAYISKEEAKRMREALRYVFPSKEGWKIGFRNENHSKASVTLSKGLFKYDGHHQLNGYVKGGEDDADIFRDLVLDSLEVANPNYDNSDVQTDYFDVGYYNQINVGSWDKPYEYNPKTKLDWDKVRDRVKKFAVRNALKKS